MGGTRLPGNDGVLAHIMPAASGMGGCDGSWVCGEDFCRGPPDGSGDSGGIKAA